MALNEEDMAETCTCLYTCMYVYIHVYIGELPMALNEEDMAEIERDKRRKIDEQLIEAARVGSLAQLQALQGLGGNLSAADDDDELQAIHHAALNGHRDVVAYLLAHAVAPNVTDAYGRTALHWAAYNGHVEVAQALLDACQGSDLKRLLLHKTPGGCTAYAFAAMFMHGDNEAINFFRVQEAAFNPDLQGRSQFVASGAGKKNNTRTAAEKNRLSHPLAGAYD